MNKKNTYPAYFINSWPYSHDALTTWVHETREWKIAVLGLSVLSLESAEKLTQEDEYVT